MTATNPITGDKIQTKPVNNKYAENYDLIFKANKEKENDSKTDES